MIKFLAAFFAFGTAMCVLTVVLLFSPGTELDWEGRGLTHGRRRNRVRLRGNRIMAKLRLGYPPRVGYSIAQHHWRLIQRPDASRFPLFSRFTYWRRDDPLFGPTPKGSQFILQ